MNGCDLLLYSRSHPKPAGALRSLSPLSSRFLRFWMMASPASSSLPLPLSKPWTDRRSPPPRSHLTRRQKKIWTVHASISASPAAAAVPGDLVANILSKVKGSDRGVLLPKEGHREVADVAQQLSRYCVDRPVRCPLIFGEWDVAYCSNPTSPGGGYRSSVGRLVFRTNEMVQAVEAPDAIRNRVSFSVFGFLNGEVSLKGKLKALDDKWIRVIFEPPQLKIGSLGFQYGGESEVKLQITYVDEKIRLGKGSRGSLFVFVRK